MHIGFIIVIILIILIEYDRRAGGFTLKAYDYYIESFPMPMIGLYNNCLRLTSMTHPAIMHDVSNWFPENHILKNNWRIMRDEALNIYNNYEMKKMHEVSSVFDRLSKATGKWKGFILKWYADDVKQAELLAPKTLSIIRKIPKLRACMFSLLEPNMTIPLHKGPYKGSLRYHLGLKIPKDRRNCFIKVDGKNYHWTDGEDIVFDDTYNHCVFNNTNEIRIVLFCDFDRPMIEPLNSINAFLNSNASIGSWIRDVNNTAEKAIPSKQ